MEKQERLEKSIWESELRFRAMADGTPFIIWVTDALGRMEFINQAYTEFFGVTLDMIQAKTWEVLVHPEDQASCVGDYMECLRARQPFHHQCRVLRKDGQWRWIISQGRPRFSEGGNFLGMAGSSLDITERKQAEEALRQSQEHFQVAIKNSPIVVYTVDRDLRYTWVYNPPFGMKPGQILGKTDDELNDPANAAQLTAFKRSVLETGIGQRQEIEWCYQGGTFFYDVTAEPIRDEKGGIVGLTVALIDITEKKRQEQLMVDNQIKLEIQRRLMEQREQERLTLAQEIHDGPAQTLVGALLELQLARDMTDDNPVLQSAFDQAESNIKNAAQELRNIIAKLRPLLLQRFGFSKAIQIHTIEFKEKHPDLELIYDIAEDPGMLSEEACLSLFRIYQEALSNISRHAGATRAIVRFSFMGEKAVLEIEDNGRGLPIAPDLIKLAEQGHYGLAGMKERAEAVDGEFQLRSGSGKGTTLIIKVPVNQK